jgi:hypothetical protein
VSDLQVTASCTAASGDSASLDGSVSITLDGSVSTYDGLADGVTEFSATGVDAAYMVVADVQCDTAAPSVRYEAIGVGAPPLPGAEPLSAVDAEAAAYSVYSLPATGLDAGALAGLALVAVIAGAALLRISRRTAA